MQALDQHSEAMRQSRLDHLAMIVAQRRFDLGIVEDVEQAEMLQFEAVDILQPGLHAAGRGHILAVELG